MSGQPDLFVVCKNCGSEVSPYVTECPYCGSRLRKRAPKLDKPGKPKPEKKPRKRPSLGRIRPGEIPGIAADVRPYATMALIVAAIGVEICLAANWLALGDLIVIGDPAPEWWRLATALFAYDSTGYAFIALVAVAIFGWLMERRHGPLVVLLLFLLAGAAGNLLAVGVETVPVSAGANGAALALLCAWAVPDLLARRRGEEIDGDLLGTAVIAVMLLLTPVAADEADWLAGAGGAVVGLLAGVPLARFGRR